MSVIIAKQKFKFYDVPITYNGRSYEDGKKICIKDAFIALKAIIIYSIKNKFYLYYNKSLCIKAMPGNFCEKAIPDPIPNSEVKLFSADGTLS